MNTLMTGIVQHAGFANRAEAWQASEQGIREAHAAGAKLIVLPELHAGLYFCQSEDTAVFDQAETIPGPTTEHFAAIAHELGVVLVTSIFERRAAGLYHNTAVVIEQDGSIAGKYRKMHIPDDPGFYEKFYFTPGDLGFAPIQTSVGKLGVLVCWDQWYPEAARLMALQGAECLIYPTAIGWGTADADQALRQQQLSAWQIMQRSHAVANGIPVLVANRIGYEKNPEHQDRGIEFWGHSFIVGAAGEVCVTVDQANTTQVVQLDLGDTEKQRRGWPFLRDRRIDAYAGLLERYIDNF